jgi:MinD superfamily P-loop ATPase
MRAAAPNGYCSSRPPSEGTVAIEIMEIRKPNYSHGYCNHCKKIQRVCWEDLFRLDNTGNYIGGDVFCKACGSIVATILYAEQQNRMVVASMIQRNVNEH